VACIWIMPTFNIFHPYKRPNGFELSGPQGAPRLSATFPRKPTH
jgi:hypothetical protein